MKKSLNYIKLAVLTLFVLVLAACTNDSVDGTYKGEDETSIVEFVIKDDKITGEGSAKQYPGLKLNMTGSVNKEKKELTIEMDAFGNKQSRTLGYEKQSNGDIQLNDTERNTKITLKKIK